MELVILFILFPTLFFSFMKGLGTVFSLVAIGLSALFILSLSIHLIISLIQKTMPLVKTLMTFIAVMIFHSIYLSYISLIFTLYVKNEDQLFENILISGFIAVLLSSLYKTSQIVRKKIDYEKLWSLTYRYAISWQLFVVVFTLLLIMLSIFNYFYLKGHDTYMSSFSGQIPSDLMIYMDALSISLVIDLGLFLLFKPVKL